MNLLLAFALFVAACGDSDDAADDHNAPSGLQGAAGIAGAAGRIGAGGKAGNSAGVPGQAGAGGTPGKPPGMTAGSMAGDAGTIATEGGALCSATGGMIATAQCCGATSDFPNSCTVGSCGCSPTNSHAISVCSCADGRCFDPVRGCTPRP